MASTDTAPGLNGLQAFAKALDLKVVDPSEPSKEANGAQDDSDSSNTLTTPPSEDGDSKSNVAKSEEKPASDDTETATKESGPKEEKGSVTNVKNIYREKDENDEWTWVDEYPKTVKEAAENEETEKFALIVRNQKSTDSRKKLEAHSIIIQSPWLKTALTHILEDYPGVTCELHRLVFDAPFAPFVHRWASFLKYMKRPDLDEKTKEHLNLLLDVLKYEIGDKIKDFEDYVLNGVITFESLWMIFQPGGVIIAAHKGPLSAFELVETEYVKNQCGAFLKIDCGYPLPPTNFPC